MNFTKSDIRVKLAESREAFRRIKKLRILWKTVVIHRLKAVVNTIGGLLASRRVLFCSYSTNSDKSISLNTRIKKNLARIAAVYQ